jgi:hypothetical protein
MVFGSAPLLSMPFYFRLICVDRPRGKSPGGRTAVSTPTLQAPLDPASIGPASRYIHETRESLLAYNIEELAVLRFSIILTARWEAFDCETGGRRAELREELAILRKHYGDRIDDIAMTFGVEAAMHAKDEVERTVVVPRDLKTIEIQNFDEEEESCNGDFQV